MTEGDRRARPRDDLHLRRQRQPADRDAARARPTAVRRPRPRPSTYDDLNRLIKTTHPDGSTTQHRIQRHRQAERTIDGPVGPAHDLRVRPTGPARQDHLPGRHVTETSTYDAEGTAHRQHRPRRAHHDATTYDALGPADRDRPTPDGTFSTQHHLRRGGPGRCASTDARGNATTYEYDAAGRRDHGHRRHRRDVTTFTYDAAGNQTHGDRRQRQHRDATRTTPTTGARARPTPTPPLTR